MALPLYHVGVQHVPVGRIDDRQLQPGPFYKKARELYMDFANSKTA